MRTRNLVLTIAITLLAASPAIAGHHLWDFTEAYSSPQGSVQFVELIGNANNEHMLTGWTVNSGTNIFTFNANTPTTLTNGKTVLIATAGFGSLPGGVTPDYTIPSYFMVRDVAGTLNYAGGADIWNHPGIPSDGINSRKRNGTSSANTPKNWNGDEGSVDLTLEAPGFPKWGIILLVGAMLLAATALLRRRETTTLA